MLRIAICDDETDARDALRFQLEKILIEDAEEIVYEFSSGTNAASWLKTHPGEIDLLFDEQITLVFVTGYSDYVFDGYHVGALDYLMKPVAEEKLRKLIGRVRTKSAQEESRSFTLKNMDGTWRFRLCDILCFYSDRRKVTLVTAEYSFYARLDEIEEQLSPDFVRIHQRYLINPAGVEYLGSESVTINGRVLPCSRRYRETALPKIARSLM